MSNQEVPGSGPPGTQRHKSNAAAAADQLTTLAAETFGELSKALHARDPEATAGAQAKLQQIQAAGAALGAQGQDGAPRPQGAQTGVAQPVGRPIDALTGQRA